MPDCGQKDRDQEILRKHAEKYAVMVLAHFPEDYESRKRIITNAVLAALQTATPIEQTNTEMLEALETLLDITPFPTNAKDAEIRMRVRAMIALARGHE